MTLRRAFLLTVALLVTVCGVIPAAQAHDYLVSSNPKAGATVTTAPKQVTLTFNDIVLSQPAKPQITVQGPDGRYYESGCGVVTDRVVTTPAALGPAGKYTVTWRIVSADGHPVSDAIAFTYRPAAGAAKATGAKSPTACAESSPAAGPSAQKSSGGGVPSGAIVAVVVIVVIGVGGAAYLLMTRGRTPRADDTNDFDDED